ncbi:MAG: hypothetical protein ACPG21_03265 [Crocinitomicaceae bacterium]
MKVLFFISLLFLVPHGYAQVVFSESFDEADDAVTGSDAIGPINWTATCPGSLAATDKVVSGKLEARDTNSPAAVFEIDVFDISTCTGLEIALDIEESVDMEACADCGGTGITCIDWVKLEYNLDGGGWTEVAGASCPATMMEAPGEMIQIGNIGGGGHITFTSPCIDFGSTMQIRISCMSWAGDEYWLFDNITVSCNDCVLPLELVEFNVNEDDNGTLLTWETRSESNNAYFAIERSYNGKSFEEIAHIEGAGTSSERLVYRYNDPQFHQSDLVYYRLRQVDFDGKSRFSQTKSLKTEASRKIWVT